MDKLLCKCNNNDMEKIKVIIDWLDNYRAVSDMIPGCVATSASHTGIQANYASAVEFHLEGLDANEVPECLKADYEFEYTMTTRALLRRLEGVISRAAIARATGINEQQLQHYMSGYRTARPDKREKILQAIHNIAKELIDVA